MHAETQLLGLSPGADRWTAKWFDGHFSRFPHSCSRIVAAVLMAACTQANTPSAASFERVLTAALSNERLCTQVDTLEAPSGTAYLDRLEKAFPGQFLTMRQLQTDVKAGKIRLITRPTVRTFGPTPGDRLMTLLDESGKLIGPGILTYPQCRTGACVETAMLDDEIAKHARHSKQGAEICWGRVSLDKVVRWTEPAEMMGVRVTHVEYLVKLSDVQEWAQPLSKAEDFDGKRQTIMVLTNEGWSVK